MVPERTQGSSRPDGFKGRGAWVEHRKADMRQMAGYGASGDDTARFLRELRQLRDGAGLGHAELAARAHFPYDSIRAAEVGPALPDLPVLSAYVRGCGGTTEEWEERWRSLTSSPSLPVSASRNAGSSDAATAGARIGSVSQVGDNPDPSVIIAALSRVAEEMASPAATAVTESPGAQPADEFASADAAFLSSDAAFPPPDLALPSAAEPFASAPEPFASAAEPFPSAPEPVTSDTPAGWDPIRVSTAWPAIRDTPDGRRRARRRHRRPPAGPGRECPGDRRPGRKARRTRRHRPGAGPARRLSPAVGRRTRRRAELPGCRARPGFRASCLPDQGCGDRRRPGLRARRAASRLRLRTARFRSATRAA